MKLTTKSRYGLRALIDLTILNRQHPGEPSSLNRIAHRQNLSVKYLEQAFRLLRKAGLVISVQGVQGGYLLSDDPSRISLDRVIRVLEGDTDLVDDNNSGDQRNSRLQDYLTEVVWRPLNEQAAAYFAGLSLADLAADPDDPQDHD